MVAVFFTSAYNIIAPSVGNPVFKIPESIDIGVIGFGLKGKKRSRKSRDEINFIGYIIVFGYSFIEIIFGHYRKIRFAVNTDSRLCRLELFFISSSVPPTNNQPRVSNGVFSSPVKRL